MAFISAVRSLAGLKQTSWYASAGSFIKGTFRRKKHTSVYVDDLIILRNENQQHAMGQYIFIKMSSSTPITLLNCRKLIVLLVVETFHSGNFTFVNG